MQALRAAGQTDDGHMLQEALLLRGLNGDQQKANAMVGAGPPVQQPASWLSLANFAIGSSQQDELMGLMWAHWEVQSHSGLLIVEHGRPHEVCSSKVSE